MKKNHWLSIIACVIFSVFYVNILDFIYLFLDKISVPRSMHLVVLSLIFVLIFIGVSIIEWYNINRNNEEEYSLLQVISLKLVPKINS